jgi:D-sorbitol dehydrogenase (acceptor)
VHYAAAKAGLISVTQSAALALAPHGITVNAVVPGIVDTPLQREVQRARGARLGVSVEEAIARAAENVPLGRLGTPEDVAEAVAFLISPEAGYMTGQLLVLDGGVQLRGLPGARPSVAQPKAEKRQNG